MEIRKTIRRRLTVNVFQAVFRAAAEVWKERRPWKMERLHLWHKALLIIEFNLRFIPHVTSDFHCAVLDNVSCQRCSVSSLLFNKSKSLLRPGRSVFLVCQTVNGWYTFILFSQYSRTQYVRSTDFKRRTASGCSCENKWRSAHCPSASPSSCFHSTYRKTTAGMWQEVCV